MEVELRARKPPTVVFALAFSVKILLLPLKMMVFCQLLNLTLVELQEF